MPETSVSIEGNTLRFAHNRCFSRVNDHLCEVMSVPSKSHGQSDARFELQRGLPTRGEVEVNNPHVVFVGEADDVWFDLCRRLEDEGLLAVRRPGPPSPLDRRVVQQAAVVIIGSGVTGHTRLELCREVRVTSLASITVISENMDEVDELRLVVAGACVIAYLPIRSRVMAAQLANRIGRVGSEIPDAVLCHLGLRVDPKEHRVTVGGSPVELTKTEFDLLALLMASPRRVYTHEEISRSLWDDPWTVDHHRLEAHVCRLRKKVSRAGGPVIICSVRAVGYRLAAPVDLAAAAPAAG